MSYTPRLKKDYKERVLSELKKQFSYKSVMQVPKIIKIVVSKGVGAAVAVRVLVQGSQLGESFSEHTMNISMKTLVNFLSTNLSNFVNIAIT